MRVPGSQVGSVETRTGETPVRRSAAESAEAAGGATHAGEAVVDGSRSREVRTHSERAESARSQKLSRIASALEAGTYQVDFHQLANRLVDDELSRSGGS